MLKTEFYVTTSDEKNRTHNYRLPNSEPVPDGHEVTNVVVASRYTLASLLSPATKRSLSAAVRNR